MFFFFFVWMVSEEMEIEENGITRILKSDMVVSSSCVLSLGKKDTAGRLVGFVGSSRYRNVVYRYKEKSEHFASRVWLICTVAPNRLSFIVVVFSTDDEISSQPVRDNAGLRRGIALGSILLRGGSWR
jgi:hypothetical protein